MINNSQIYKQDLIITKKHILNLEKLQNSSILITGATGTVGSFLVDVLAEFNNLNSAGITIYAAGRSRERLSTCFDTIKQYGVKYVEYDLLKSLNFDFPVDYIIHVAGNAYPAAFSENPVETLYGSIFGAYNILEYARNHNVKRVLYISSGEVYGQGDISLSDYKEDYCGYVDPMSARSCYPNGKRATETLCASFVKEYKIDCVVARLCHTYGPTITKNDNRANVQFFHNVLNDEDIVLKSAATQMRSYNYIADAASAIFSVLTSGICGEVYNIANKQSVCTIADFAKYVAAASNHKVIFKIPDENDKKNLSPIPKQVLNTEKLEKLGWKGFFSIKDGIYHTLNILRGN